MSGTPKAIYPDGVIGMKSNVGSFLPMLAVTCVTVTVNGSITPARILRES